MTGEDGIFTKGRTGMIKMDLRTGSDYCFFMSQFVLIEIRYGMDRNPGPHPSYASVNQVAKEYLGIDFVSVETRRLYMKVISKNGTLTDEK